MPTTRLCLTYAAVLALISGCAESSNNEPKLIPIQSARGFVTYRYENEEPAATPPMSSSNARSQSLEYDVVARQRRQDEQYDRDMAQWRGDRGEQVRREAREEQAYHAMTRDLRQAQASQGRQERQNYRDQEANRRQVIQRQERERFLAERRSQQEAEATASLLRLQQRQLQQQAGLLQP